MISIIIPVYNVSRFLSRCLDSILNQSYSDFEVILVDDASTDSSKAICKKYALKDERFHLIENKRNLGISLSRNKGLLNSRGEYITFIDSDDEISQNYLEILMGILLEYDVDISCVKWNHVSEEYSSSNQCLQNNELAVKLYDNSSYMKYILSPRSGSYVWGKLYKRASLEDVWFEEGMNYEDILYTAKVLTKASKIALVDAVLYHYRQVSTSIVHSIDIKTGDLLIAQELRLAVINEYFPELYEMARGLLLTKCITLEYSTSLLKKSYERVILRKLIKNVWGRNSLSMWQLLKSDYSKTRKSILLIGNISLYMAGYLKHILVRINNR